MICLGNASVRNHLSSWELTLGVGVKNAIVGFLFHCSCLQNARIRACNVLLLVRFLLKFGVKMNTHNVVLKLVSSGERLVGSAEASGRTNFMLLNFPSSLTDHSSEVRSDGSAHTSHSIKLVTLCESHSFFTRWNQR